jgi:hypothetical protein
VYLSLIFIFNIHIPAPIAIRIMDHATKKGEHYVKSAKSNLNSRIKNKNEAPSATATSATPVSSSSDGPGLFGEFSRFVTHLGNEIKKDVGASTGRGQGARR